MAKERHLHRPTIYSPNNGALGIYKGSAMFFSLHNNTANLNMFLISPPGDERGRSGDCSRPSGDKGY